MKSSKIIALTIAALTISASSVTLAAWDGACKSLSDTSFQCAVETALKNMHGLAEDGESNEVVMDGCKQGMMLSTESGRKQMCLFDATVTFIADVEGKTYGCYATPIKH